MPRLAPITGKSDVPAEHHAVVDAVTKVFGGVRGPFSMLLHSPKLAERVLGLVTFFRDESVVDNKLLARPSRGPLGLWDSHTLSTSAVASPVFCGAGSSEP